MSNCTAPGLYAVPITSLARSKDRQIAVQNCLLIELSLDNNGPDCYVQLYDSARKLNVLITDTDITAETVTAPGHGFQTGDAVTITGVAPFTTGYLRAIDANTFSVHPTRADALAGTEVITPDADNDTGTLELTANAGILPAYENAVAAGTPMPYEWAGGYQFHRGLYVRCVTAVGGSTLIGGDDIKFGGRIVVPWPLFSQPTFQ